MFQDKKVIVVMPAYNAAKTLLQTHQEVLAQGVVELKDRRTGERDELSIESALSRLTA